MPSQLPSYAVIRPTPRRPGDAPNVVISSDPGYVPALYRSSVPKSLPRLGQIVPPTPKG